MQPVAAGGQKGNGLVRIWTIEPTVKAPCFLYMGYKEQVLPRYDIRTRLLITPQASRTVLR